MKLKYLLLFAASLFLIDGAPSFSAPVQLAAQYRSRSESSNGYGSCQTAKSAVVTVYAGREIGSGSIVSSEGLVITNYHVVNGVVGSRGGGQLSVRTADGRRIPGSVIGTDRTYDLALIQLDAQERFPTIPLASTDSVQMGENVCAIGSPFGRPGVLTTGTLSKVRSNGDLQSNVVLNPGNSGGPLLNTRGEMVGVNKAILQSASGRNTGISFATNIRAARSFIEQKRPGSLAGSIAQTPVTRPPVQAIAPLPPVLVPAPPNASTATGGGPEFGFEPPPAMTTPIPSVAAPPNGGNPIAPNDIVVNVQPDYGTTAIPVPSVPPTANYPNPQLEYPQPTMQRPPAANIRLGVTVDARNMVIRNVESGSPAAMGGLRAGDRLVAINGNQLSQFEDLKAFLSRQPDSAVFTVNRNQQVATVRVSF